MQVCWNLKLYPTSSDRADNTVVGKSAEINKYGIYKVLRLAFWLILLYIAAKCMLNLRHIVTQSPESHAG